MTDSRPSDPGCGHRREASDRGAIRKWLPKDRVVLEATGNALAIARILEPHVAQVLLAHAKDVRAISHAKGQDRQA